MRSSALAAVAVGLGALTPRAAGVTVYGQVPLHQAVSTVSTAGSATYTGAAAYDPLVLVPPPVPTGLASIVTYNLTSAPALGASIKQNGSFFGLSIEMSVTNQALGKNSSHVAVPFLNLMANLKQRSGQVNIRVGGNTQETAKLVDSLANGTILQKDKENTSNPTQTPPLDFTLDLLYLMSNISSLIGANWWLGIPFFDVPNAPLDLMVYGEAILGDHMLGYQIGNEPDLYVAHGHRNQGYGPFDYFGEFNDTINKIAANNSIPVKNNLIGPNVASGDGNWTPEMVWNTGFLDAYKDNLKYLAVEHYPTDNCAAQFGGPNDPKSKDPQTELAGFVTHQAGQGIAGSYLNSTGLAQVYQKPMIMFETNTASCGGFAGISNSFVAALWALDYGLQLAHSNFSGANLHVGGQHVFYNPFTPPPTNQSAFNQWTVGPIYYSMLAVAEAFGLSGTAQIMDLYPQSQYQPNYAIWENGKASKFALFNFVSDNTTASDYTFAFSVEGGVPSQVKVKYLLAPFLTSKDNITWAGQTFGSQFESDGRFKGELNVTSVACDTGANSCSVRVPAPGFALVFLNGDDPIINDGAPTQAAQTFSTTAVTKTRNTATIDPSVLATSNGSSGKDRKFTASTSKGGLKSGAARGVTFPSIVVVLMALAVILGGGRLL